MTEKEFQQQIQDLAKLCGWLSYHTHDSRRSANGFPDLVLIHPTHGLLFREIKTDTGRLTPEQERWLAVLSCAGADAGVWRPSDWHLIESTLKGE